MQAEQQPISKPMRSQLLATERAHGDVAQTQLTEGADFAQAVLLIVL